MDTDPQLAQLQDEMIPIINTYAYDLKGTHNLYLNHSSVTDQDGQIVVYLDFWTQELVDVNEARKIMVDVVEGYVKRLNEGTKMGPYVPRGGYTFRNLYVNIDYSSYFGQFVDPLYVGRSELKEGDVTAYYAHTALNEWPDDRAPFHMHTEPYERSRQFVFVELQAKKKKIEERLEQLKEDARRRRIDEVRAGGLQ